MGRDTVGSLTVNASKFINKTITLGKDYAIQMQPSVSENEYLDKYDWALRAQVQLQRIAAGKALLNPELNTKVLMYVDPQNTSII